MCSTEQGIRDTMVSLTMHPPPEAAAAATGASLSLLAGCSGGPGKLDGKAGVALLYRPSGMAMAPNGTLYISDNHNCIRQLTRAGEVSLFAGSHQAARGLLTDHSRSMGAVDGLASAARFRYPQGLVLDGAGNLYVADSGNHTIRKVSPAGQVTTLAGAAGMPGHVDARSVCRGALECAARHARRRVGARVHTQRQLPHGGAGLAAQAHARRRARGRDADGERRRRTLVVTRAVRGTPREARPAPGIA